MPPPKNKPTQNRDVSISKALSLLLRHAAEKEGLKMNAQGYASVADVMAWRKLKSLKVTFPEIIKAVSSSDKKRFALLHIPSTQVDSKTQGTEIPMIEDPTSALGSSAPSTSEGQENATEIALSVQDSDPSHFLIRATQGHSMKSVDAASFLEKLTLSDASTLPDTVVHGTFHSAWPLILKSEGLRCMGRNHIHFATGPSLESVLPGPVDATAESAKDALQLNDGRVISGMRRDAQVLIFIDIRKALAAGCPFWRSENGVILSEGMPAGETADDNETKQKVVPLEFFDVVVERTAGMGKIWEDGKTLQEIPVELLKRGNPKGRRTRPNDKNGKQITPAERGQ
ncbi:hypothetical protein ASPWEDRAFT_36699 [Aspergillus wentii DTO 134E9]|uniref:2'-phosphotransferase n=1 Tax=Aspergillus wentii DTO 134E9 TaxID=1073089 RepID=A0A1L9RVN6_ASPWE|nr:uncharacterized protein ASPWEDRAFT_36699 [Aspergillus wentii DTO 134E9]KAI9928883.1 hypothetical protein MW887_002106 [Aspergillus wentii]OJJ38989.1 hypothetical protein ASPWEDRAFT_36699 [Aspergillus wentii DTO 134E9]